MCGWRVAGELSRAFALYWQNNFSSRGYFQTASSGGEMYRLVSLLQNGH